MSTAGSLYSASRIAHGTEADPLPNARVSAAAELGGTLPLPESPSHLEDAPMDARLDSSDPPAHRRLTPGTRTGAPKRPEPQRPPQTQGTLLVRLAPSSVAKQQVPIAPHHSRPLPLRSRDAPTRTPRLRGAGTAGRRTRSALAGLGEVEMGCGAVALAVVVLLPSLTLRTLQGEVTAATTLAGRTPVFRHYSP